MGNKHAAGKRILCILLSLTMLLSMMPTAVFAAGSADENSGEDFNPLQYITPEVLFEKIKGSNASMNDITADLTEVKEEQEYFYVTVDPDTKEITWNTSPYYGTPRANVKLEWISSSAPEYIAVNEDENRASKVLKLLKRPVLSEGEEAKEVTLTLKMTGVKEAEGKTGELNLNLKITPGEKIKSPFDYVKEGLFDSIKGENESDAKVTSDLIFPVQKPAAYIQVDEGGQLSWKSSAYSPHDVQVTFNESSRPDILAVPAEGDTSPKGITLVNRPAEDTQVIIKTTLTDKYIPSIKEDFDLHLTVLSEQEEEPDILDIFTPELLFDSIRGENTAADSVTEALQLPANGYNPYYAKLKEDGSFDRWWSSKYGAKAKIEIVKSDRKDLIRVGEDDLTIVKYPEKDTTVNLTFEITEVADETNKREITVPVVLKAKKSDVLEVITEQLLFDAVKGENKDAGQIGKPLTLPAGSNDSNPFYAKLNNDGTFKQWWGGFSGAQIKVELKSSDHPELIEVGEDKLNILKFPESRTDVELTFEATELSNQDNKKEVKVSLTLKSQADIDQEKETQQQLSSYLDKYLKPEYITYNQIRKPGVSFADDYENNNVRYIFNVPNITSLENLPYGEVQSEITVDTPSSMNLKYKYTCEPVRDDVGGQDRTVTITYTLKKGEYTVSKDFSVVVPALTEEEIDEELTLLKDIKQNIFEGIKGKNYDRENVTDSLKDTLYEARYDENGNLTWSDSSKENLYYGFRFPSNESWDVEYISGDTGLFNAVNMVLEKRPSQDTQVTATHTIESVQLQRYAELYPQNEKLQQLKKQPVSVDFTVRKINASLESLSVAGEDIDLNGDQKIYSVLTEETLTEAQVKATPENKGAALIIAGSDCTHLFSRDVALQDGFARFVVSVSDEDNKQAGSRQTEDVQLTVASRPYMEAQIAALPASVDQANAGQLQIAGQLWNQYWGLEESDRETIAGHEKLEAYGEVCKDPLEESRDQVSDVCLNLFEGIRGENPSASLVYTDLQEISYARIDGEDIEWSKDPADSDIRIEWVSSDKTQYVDVHDGNDFESGYVQAFCLKKRPSDKPVTIKLKAKVTHLADPSVSTDTEVQFTLREYNAELESLTVEEFTDFIFEPQKTEYTVFNTKGAEKISLAPKAVIPGAKITVDGEALETAGAEIPLRDGEAVVKIRVNDGIKNTLNDKWAEKEYTISVLTSLDSLKEAIDDLPGADSIDKDNYQQYKNTVSSLTAACDALSDQQREQIGQTSIQKLALVSEKISLLSLEAAKEKAAAELEAYQDEEGDYTAENWEKVLSAKKTGRENIFKAATESEVLRVLTEAKAAVYAVTKKDMGQSAKDVSLKSIMLLPGEHIASETSEGSYSVTIPGEVDKVMIRAAAGNPKAKVQINGSDLNASNDWTSPEAFDIPRGGQRDVSVKVVSSDGTQSKTYILTIKRASWDEKENISVNFCLMGDSLHGEGNHQDTEVWIADTKVSVPKGSTVKYLTDKMLIDNGISFVTKSNGTYISQINGLAELDNGKNSGWMYTVNGKSVSQLYSERTLSEGDVIEWFYTDDYTKEDLKPAYDAREVMAMIQALPETDSLTLSDAADVQQAKSAYDALSAEEKAKVTDEARKKLEAAVLKIAELKSQAAAGIQDIFRSTGDYIAGMLKDNCVYGAEWNILGLARAGRTDEIDSSAYYKSIAQIVKSKGSPQLSKSKSSENSRVIIALTALGIDPSDVEGFNLLAPLANMDYVNRQGINGAIYALIAFDTHDYQIPAVSKGTQTTREGLIDLILKEQLSGGGWSLGSNEADPDMTAMAVQSLARYCQSDARVKVAVDKAINCLSDLQNLDGSYTSRGEANSESCAQVITALTTMGIDPENDERFVKNGYSVTDALRTFYVEGGGFKHVESAGIDAMATEQGYYALAAYDRMINGKTALYDMSDVTLQKGTAGAEGEGPADQNTDSKADMNQAASPSKTGDEATLLLWSLMTAAGAIGILSLRRKENR
ncbi:MAG: cadherin-like beta sandwich domain-containing protein [Anaerovoracaceae bacterium]